MKPVSNRKRISGTTDRVTQQQEIRAGGGHSEQVRSNESGRQAHHGILPKMARAAIESHEAVALYGAYQAKTIWCYDCRFWEYGRKNVMVRQY